MAHTITIPQEKNPESTNMFRDFHVTTCIHRDNNSCIKIYELSHIATHSFYDNVLKHVQQDQNNGFTIHLEGIRNVPTTIPTLGSVYQRIASELDLADQKTYLYPKIENGHNRDIEWSMIPPLRQKSITTMAKILGKTIHTATHDEQTKKKLKQQLEQSFITPEKNNRITALKTHILLGKKITHGRSLYATDNAIIQATGSGKVSLIWGKSHSKDIISELNRRGYNIESSELIMGI